MKKFVFLPIVLFIFWVISCENSSSQKEEVVVQKVEKFIEIQAFSAETFSEETQKIIKNWWSFKSLYQVFSSLTHTEAEPLFSNENPDSLVVFKRFYSHTAQLTHTRLEKDWRSGETSADTIHRLVKTRKTEEAFAQWEEKILGEVPYVFSFRVKPSSVNELQIQILQKTDNQIIYDQNIQLDSIEKNPKSEKLNILSLYDSWHQFEVSFENKTSENCLFLMKIPEKYASNDYFLMYRNELLLAYKDRQKVPIFSQKNRENSQIKTSYKELIHWLYQMEDELKQLWAKRDFPDEFDLPSVRSRLKLFETYVRDFLSEIKRNPEISSEQANEQIQKINDSFSLLIQNFNAIVSDNSHQKIQQINSKNNVK